MKIERKEARNLKKKRGNKKIPKFYSVWVTYTSLQNILMTCLCLINLTLPAICHFIQSLLLWIIIPVFGAAEVHRLESSTNCHHSSGAATSVSTLLLPAVSPLQSAFPPSSARRSQGDVVRELSWSVSFEYLQFPFWHSAQRIFLLSAANDKWQDKLWLLGSFPNPSLPSYGFSSFQACGLIWFPLKQQQPQKISPTITPWPPSLILAPKKALKLR